MSAATESPATGPKGSAPRDAESSERASSFVSLSRVMMLGFVRDRTALFFTLAMPLMFLLLFGALFKSAGASHVKFGEVGQVQVLDGLPADARAKLDKSIAVTKYTDADAALAKLRKGDLDGVIEQDADGRITVRYSASDQVKSGVVQTIAGDLVNGANLAATGQAPKYALSLAQVEDESLKPIQYLTPGLLGWAIATGAVFGTSFTLVNWRKKRVLRRLRLAPVSIGAVVAARVTVSVAVSLAQTAIFLVVATTPFFGLKLTGNWPLVIPVVVCSTIAFMSIGLLTGSIAKSEEAANGINQVIVLPMSFLAGAFFPLDGAPTWLQDVSRVLPLRYLVTSAQSVLTKGGGVMDILPSMGGLLLFAAVLTAISWKFFRWDDA